MTVYSSTKTEFTLTPFCIIDYYVQLNFRIIQVTTLSPLTGNPETTNATENNKCYRNQ